MYESEHLFGAMDILESFDADKDDLKEMKRTFEHCPHSIMTFIVFLKVAEKASLQTKSLRICKKHHASRTRSYYGPSCYVLNATVPRKYEGSIKPLCESGDQTIHLKTRNYFRK